MGGGGGESEADKTTYAWSFTLKYESNVDEEKEGRDREMKKGRYVDRRRRGGRK